MSDREQECEQKQERKEREQQDKQEQPWEGFPGDWCPHCNTSLHNDCMSGPDE